MSERKMLTIGCKLPSGLIMEAGKPGESNYTQVQLNGANQGEYVGRQESGKIFIPKTEQGYGLTQVDSEFFAAWRKQYKVNAERWIREGIIFVVEDKASAQAAAADNVEVKTGYEQLNPDKTPGISSASAE